METVANFPDLASAQLAQSLLEAEGIAATIPDEHLAGIDWQLSTALQGVRLQVAREDLDAAKELLAEQFAPDDDADATAEKSLCPKCGVELTEPYHWLRRRKGLTMLFAPLLLIWPLIARGKPKYECPKCRQLFREQ